MKRGTFCSLVHNTVIVLGLCNVLPLKVKSLYFSLIRADIAETDVILIFGKATPFVSGSYLNHKVKDS